MQQQLKAIIKQHDLTNEARYKLFNICLIAYQQLTKKKGYTSTKSFFTSPANKFIEQLIHIHSDIINKVLKVCVKQHTSKVLQKEYCENLSCFRGVIANDSSQAWKNHSKENVIGFIGQVLNYFLSNQCYNKSQAERQNVYLEIQCSLNYTCPVCLSKKDIPNIKSSAEIKFGTDHQELFENKSSSQTTKQIKTQVEQKRLPPLTPKPLQRILDALNQKRKSLKQIEDNRKIQSNKQWHLFGKLLDLNRQQFNYNSINIPKLGCKDELLQELQLRNYQNKNQINKFRKKLKLKGIKPIQDDQNCNFSKTRNSSFKSTKRQKSNNFRFAMQKISSIDRSSLPKRQITTQMRQQRQRKTTKDQIMNRSVNKVKVNCIELGNGHDNIKTNKLIERVYSRTIRAQIYSNLIMKSQHGL